MQEDKENVDQQEKLILNALHLKIANSLGIKGINVDKLKKNLSENQENQRNCQKIISTKSMIEYFLVVQTTPETCQIYLDLTEVKVKKKKALFFFKLFQNSLNSKNIQKMVFLEVNKNPLRTLHLLFGQILIPIMQNQKN